MRTVAVAIAVAAAVEAVVVDAGDLAVAHAVVQFAAGAKDLYGNLDDIAIPLHAVSRPETMRHCMTVDLCIHSPCRLRRQSLVPVLEPELLRVEEVRLVVRTDLSNYLGLVGLAVAPFQAPLGSWKDHAVSVDGCRHPSHPKGPTRIRLATYRRLGSDALEATEEGSHGIPVFQVPRSFAEIEVEPVSSEDAVRDKRRRGLATATSILGLGLFSSA